MIGPSPSQTTNVMKKANQVMCNVLIFACPKAKILNLFDTGDTLAPLTLLLK